MQKYNVHLCIKEMLVTVTVKLVDTSTVQIISQFLLCCTNNVSSIWRLFIGHSFTILEVFLCSSILQSYRICGDWGNLVQEVNVSVLIWSEIEIRYGWECHHFHSLPWIETVFGKTRPDCTVHSFIQVLCAFRFTSPK